MAETVAAQFAYSNDGIDQYFNNWFKLSKDS
jgi:hypothetical protein